MQSLVNSFGVATMAAFAAGVKIDSFAYSPAQDFANGFATFVAQNTGAGKPDRGSRASVRRRCFRSPSAPSFPRWSSLCAAAAHAVHRPGDREILAGVHICAWRACSTSASACCSCSTRSIAGLNRRACPSLTVISLGLRVALAYAFAPHFGVTAIWLAIPIGWFIADAVGLIRLKAALPH